MLKVFNLKLNQTRINFPQINLMKSTNTDFLAFFRSLQVSKETLSDHESPDNPYISRSEMIKTCSQKAPVIAKRERKLRRDNTFDLNNRPDEIQLKTNRTFPDKRLTTSTLEKFLKMFLEKPMQADRKPDSKCRIKYSSCDSRSSIGELCLQKYIISMLEEQKKWVKNNISLVVHCKNNI